MNDPHDDTDVPSGTTDGAQMESTSPPVLRLENPTSLRGTADDSPSATDAGASHTGL